MKNTSDVQTSTHGEPPVGASNEHLQRNFNNRQVQLLAIGGSIGTAIYISIGNGLAEGGPASLLLAYILYSVVMACINNCFAEMITQYPVEGGFVALAGHFIDDAMGFVAGWNFFIYEAMLIPFEISAVNLVLGYYRPDIPAAAVCMTIIAIYAVINALPVKTYAEAEFWLSSGKVVLIFILFMFTLVTMSGGNPQHDAYGFRNWNTPSAFAESALRPSTGDLGRFEGFLGCLWNAAFTIVGPEYVATAAAEAQHPRRYLKTAYKVMYGRFVLFFVFSALCVGIVVPWNDPALQAVLKGVASHSDTVAASPYVIAMRNMGIDVLPGIVCGLLISSIFSAGNTYFYCAVRTLHGLAEAGRAPSILKRTTKKGVPIYAYFVVLPFPFLSLMTLSKTASAVLPILIDVITAGALINFMIGCITYIQMYSAYKMQGIDRRRLPYYGYMQPYCAWVGLVSSAAICLCYGYTAFVPWKTAAFFKNYTLQILALILFFGRKAYAKTEWVRPGDIDLEWKAKAVDEYEENCTTLPTGFWVEILQLFGLRKTTKEITDDHAGEQVLSR